MADPESESTPMQRKEEYAVTPEGVSYSESLSFWYFRVRQGHTILTLRIRKDDPRWEVIRLEEKEIKPAVLGDLPLEEQRKVLALTWKAWGTNGSLEETPSPTAPRQIRSCNRHFNCEVAEQIWFVANATRKHLPVNFHCHDDECPDCFGC
jgi:hypothetical protein